MKMLKKKKKKSCSYLSAEQPWAGIALVCSFTHSFIYIFIIMCRTLCHVLGIIWKGISHTSYPHSLTGLKNSKQTLLLIGYDTKKHKMPKEAF